MDNTATTLYQSHAPGKTPSGSGGGGGGVRIIEFANQKEDEFGAKKKEKDASKWKIVEEVNGLSCVTICQIVAQFATLKRVQISMLRRAIRPCRSFLTQKTEAEHTVAALITHLGFKFFEKFTASQILHTVSTMNVAKYHAGEYVFRKGSTGRHFYCVFNGEVEVIMREGARPIAVLGVGQSFGELALINNAPRAASVRAIGTGASGGVVLGAISREDFQALTQQQRVLDAATAKACAKLTIPFSEYGRASASFLDRMAAVMEQRRIVVGREVTGSGADRSNLVDDLVILSKGEFELVCDILIEKPPARSAFLNLGLSSASATALSHGGDPEYEQSEKLFRNVVIGKYHKKGALFGLDVCLWGFFGDVTGAGMGLECGKTSDPQNPEFGKGRGFPKDTGHYQDLYISPTGSGGRGRDGTGRGVRDWCEGARFFNLRLMAKGGGSSKKKGHGADGTQGTVVGSEHTDAGNGNTGNGNGSASGSGSQAGKPDEGEETTTAGADGNNICVVYVIPKKKFRKLISDEPELRRWLERYYGLLAGHERGLMGHICGILKKPDFARKKFKYIQSIHETIEHANQMFVRSVDWKYFLEDIQERGKERGTLMGGGSGPPGRIG